ncbi:hypothetical protein D1AOALGA4SA_8219 [Olavius algarvensis Delta 1 endosymbiont]|nr:hypothetical protein D1AOALGA4SA_8219 [Olavius algarvensis Delta 1 endosymbiont]
MKLLTTISAIITILVLAACAGTPAGKTASPTQENTRSTPPAESSAASKPSESGQQDSQIESQAGETGTTEAARDPKTEPNSTPPAGSEPQKSAPDSKIGKQAQEESAADKLSQAREDLRISQETEKRIAAELQQLKESGNPSAEAVRDYETYLESVKAMTAENRKMLAEMEAAYAAGVSAESGADEFDKMADPDIPETQSIGEVAALDRQLNASLAKFDGILLKEMNEIRADSSKILQDLATEAAGAAKRLRQKGLDVETSGSKSAGKTQKDGEAKDRESTADRKGGQTASRDRSGKGGEGPTRTDGRRAEYEDDDIVARQLREAAENETDPELKEKLWKEYDEYKKSQ